MQTLWWRYVFSSLKDSKTTGEEVALSKVKDFLKTEKVRWLVPQSNLIYFWCFEPGFCGQKGYTTTTYLQIVFWTSLENSSLFPAIKVNMWSDLVWFLDLAGSHKPMVCAREYGLGNFRISSQWILEPGNCRMLGLTPPVDFNDFLPRYNLYDLT